MKKFAVLVFSLVFSMSVLAGEVQSRSLFEFSAKSGDIKRMQVDLLNRSGHYFARVKSLLRDGSTRTGELVCTKLNASEFRCSRDDGGGNFVLKTGAKPSLTLAYFYAGDEEETVKAEIHVSGDEPITILGKKAVIHNRDSF
jgi:hypothetical protein